MIRPNIVKKAKASKPAPVLVEFYLHCEPKKHTKMFLSYLPQNPVASDKIWYTMSGINFRYSSLNVFQLA